MLIASAQLSGYHCEDLTLLSFLPPSSDIYIHG